MHRSLQPLYPTLYPSLSISQRFCEETCFRAATMGFLDSFSAMIIRQRLERQAKNGTPFACVCGGGGGGGGAGN